MTGAHISYSMAPTIADLNGFRLTWLTPCIDSNRQPIRKFFFGLRQWKFYFDSENIEKTTTKTSKKAVTNRNERIQFQFIQFEKKREEKKSLAL